MDDEMKKQQETSEVLPSPVHPVAAEAVIVIRTAEAETVSVEDGGVSKANEDDLETSKVSVDKLKKTAPEPDKHKCVIDVKGSDAALNKENWDSEKVCRICHLSADRPNEALDLIQLGCGCKGELGVAHRHCAEAWFKLKGNRYCEICGGAAKNITGVGDRRFMEEWNDRQLDGTNPSRRREAFWRGQLFCNFLMACLVIAFVLPWFFRVNLF